ncbi:EAL domain-containing protein [Oceanisphaera pacifica]|uniref:GGDEF domain-containing protein n=1 Tax=Oceanisphaera pacifica TaxID=2818389 RepID=A0ABS3NEY9_9GAMM|nr:GGDEF domain-containing protein [Oceanisphaera pacifica]MBO1519095.1 GGDEF domain-containing protein [Oceanisphaera pacifica]
MRVTRPFGQTLLLSGFIALLLSTLLPWWASHHSLQQQVDKVNNHLAYIVEAPSSSLSLFNIAALSRGRPLESQNQAWWFGQVAANHQYTVDKTPVFYQLDIETATRQWVQISLPLILLTLLIFTFLYRSWRKVQYKQDSYFQTLLHSPEQAKPNSQSPIEQGIVAFHRHHHDQLDNLQQQLERAEQQSYQDSLTGLGNRFAFRRDLNLILDDENQLATATLMMVRASALQEINTEQGFQAGDQYLQDMVALIRKTIQSEVGATAYRVGGSEFAVLTKGQCEPLAKQLGTLLNQELHHYQHIHHLSCAAYMGFTQILPGQAAEQVLIRADLALAQAQGGEPNTWSMVLKQNKNENMGESQWRQRLQTMLTDNRILLQVQPVKVYKQEMLGYNEIYTRFPNEDGGVYQAGTVFAMLQRLNMSMLFEQKIIEMILAQIHSHALPQQRWAINLTPASLQQSSFLIWLERILMRDRDIASKLVFELDEQVLQHQLVAAKRLLAMIRRSGARFAVSQFGHGYGSFRLLKDIKPDYVKLDGLLVRQIQEDGTTLQFIRMIVDLSQRLGCFVIAEGVETEQQKDLLESMHIDGVQGYLIAKPCDMSHFKGLVM